MHRLLAVLSLILVSFSCSDSDSSVVQDSTESEWSVDRNKVTGELNLFPLSIEPEYKSVSEISLPDEELVAMVNFGSEIRVYPYVYTNPFEVVNDKFNGKNIAISYCPITKSGICFDRNLNNGTLYFRGSGYLYNDNLMPYDEETQSIWSQMGHQAVNGPLKGTKFKAYNLIETKWGTIKENFAKAKVFRSDSNGQSKSGKAPPEDEENDNNDGSPPEDGDFVYGIFTGNFSSEIRIFEYSQFSGTQVYDFKIGDQNLVVVGNKSKRIISSYYASGNFKAVKDKFPIVMVNEANGSEYNIFGAAVSGPDTGQRLNSPKSFVAIWWAWKEFYDNFEFNEL